ncbi:ABC transporter ATP-binding protein [Streptococcus sobrinus]|uniref:ABC transporter ATP-binding protein n=1 Tax=Streptococcus sobrinus TaxID=1310 RepID=UPI0002E4A414|nr:ABC transporter transmembrane domain-containing protein [Streptococcus sobrinus]
MIIKKLWWFFRLEKARYLIGILSLSFVSILNLIPPKVMGQVIDSIDAKNLTMGSLLTKLVILLAAAIGMYLLRLIWRVFLLGTSYRLGTILRGRLFEHFTQMSPSFFQKYRTGDLMAHATNDINALTMLAGAGVMSAVDASITALVTLLTMFLTISWFMTLIAIIPFFLMALTTSWLGHKNHESFKAALASFSDLNNKVQESVSGIKVTKSFGYQADESASFAKTNQANFKKNLISMRYNSMFTPVTMIFVGASYVLTLLVGAYLISAGTVTVGSLVTFITYLDMLVWPLQAIGFLFNISQRGNVSYDRISKLLSEDSDVQETAHPLASIENGPITYDIKDFAYEDETTLSDIHFQLEKGQTLGLVGQTGSGKTTLLKLLLREYDVQDGSISLNGHNIKDYKISDLRSLMGYVPQDQFLFAMSILENIRFSNPDLTLDQVQQAAKLAQVYDDIVAMPDGFETLIGEKGVSLSGGQKQRIAMARAMIMDPEILILDDSLSAVDAKTENAIIEHLKETCQGKTTMITAHRLSAVVHSDLILVMQDGRIIERGRHEDLLAQGGWYARTYASQQLEMEGGDHGE